MSSFHVLGEPSAELVERRPRHSREGSACNRLQRVPIPAGERSEDGERMSGERESETHSGRAEQKRRDAVTGREGAVDVERGHDRKGSAGVSGTAE